MRNKIKELELEAQVSVQELPDIYPAGDEQVLVYELTGRVVPETGIPIAVGCVVINTETALNIFHATQGEPVVDKYVTIAGKVPEPVTVKVPVGTPIRDVIALSGLKSLAGYAVIDGGPMMGPLATNLDGFVTKKTKALEKKKAFAIELSGLTNVFGVNGVTFQVFNSDGRQVATLSGKKKTASYYKEVTMKTLKYNLDLFTIKAVVIDSNNKTYTLAQTTKADQRMKKGTLTVTKKKNATCIYKLSGAYVPGNIKKVEFDIYRIKNGKKKKLGTYKAKASSNKKTYTVTVKNEAKGTYEVRAFATSAWKSRLLLKKKKFKLKKSDLGKNGWYYEKYKGKKYKFYYITERNFGKLYFIRHN